MPKFLLFGKLAILSLEYQFMSSINCPSCNAHNSSNTGFCTSCRAVLNPEQSTPYQTPSSQPEAALISAYAFAGFWKRLIAHIFDGIIFSVLFGLLALLLGVSVLTMSPNNPEYLNTILGYSALSMPAWWLYFALMESSSAQATFGKRIMGIKVTDIHGQPIGFGQATGRHFAGAISYLIFYIGYLMVAFTARKQALHDMIAGTLVVNNRYGPSQINIASVNPGRGMSVGGIIAIIFLVLLIPVGGILAAIAIPAYQDYTIKAKISQAIAESSTIQFAITAHAEETGYWPNTLQQAGIDQQLISNENYQIQLAAEGAYQIIFKQPERIVDNRLNFTPQLIPTGQYEWQCSSRDLKDAYLPSSCR